MNEFVLHIEEGKILNPGVVNRKFSALPDGSYMIRIHTRRQRSLQQNAYYWAVVVDMVLEGLREIGYDEFIFPDQAHEYLKEQFLRKQIVNKKNGEVIEIIMDSKELTTFQFSEYIEKIQRWAAEYLGINIPNPNEQLKMYDDGD